MSNGTLLIQPNCPHCFSSNAQFKAKAGQWECQDCEKRFVADSDSAFEQVAHLADKAARPLRIFFSYGHDEHKQLVDLFKADLERRGHTVWIDYKNIGSWDNWRGSITRGIEDSQLAIAFLSRHALRDPGVCRNEIALALHRFGDLYPVALEPLVKSDAPEGDKKSGILMEEIPVKILNFQLPDLSQWEAIRNGEVPGEDWARWYEARLLEMVHKLEGLGSDGLGRSSEENNVLRKVLTPANFEARLVQHTEGFVGRQWVFDEYERWLKQADSRQQAGSQLFWLKAGPGVGKTAMAAQLIMRQRATIVGSWFVDSKSDKLRDPGHAIRTLAFQWALRWPDYRTRLLSTLGLTSAYNTTDEQTEQKRKDLVKMPPQDLFDELIVNPLHGLIWREHALVTVIDGLDEATDAQGANPLTDFLAQQLSKLPPWICFVVTSRPDPAVVARLQGFKPFAVDAQDERNQTDLCQYYDESLAPLPVLTALPEAEQRSLRELVLQRSEGMMLYLKLVHEGLREGSLTATQLPSMPSGLLGLHSHYHDRFQHRFNSNYDNIVKPLLRLLVAAAGPLPEDLAQKTLACSAEELHAATLSLGSYVLTTPQGLDLFHKTLREWLSHKENNNFWVDAQQGRQQLADILFAQLLGGEGIYSLPWQNQIVDWLPQYLPFIQQKNDARCLTFLANALIDMARYKAAEPLYRKALAMRRDALPPGDPTIAGSLNNLAVLLGNTGRNEEAEPLYREALAMQRAALPLGHPDILAVGLNNLAGLLENTGRYAEAEPLHREALDIQRAALPLGHPDIARGLNNLARLLGDTGRYAEAEPLHREALDIRRAALPLGHPDIASSLNDLAGLLNDTGRYAEAEPLFREALDIQRAALPPSHPATANNLNHLAVLLDNTGRYAEAEPLHREALDIRRTALPPGHPATAISLNNLAGLLNNTGRYAEAEPLHREALDIRRTALPPGHPDIAESLNNLAGLLQNADRDEEAEPLYREALDIRRAALTPGHPAIVASMRDLADLLQNAGRHEEAEPLYREALDIQRAALPLGHPDIASSLNNLAGLLDNTGHYAEAEPLYREALDIQRAALPLGHPNIAFSLSNLAGLLNNTGRYAEAEPLHREALDMVRNLLPAGHPEIATSLHNLAIALQNTGRFEEAEPLYREALDIKRATLSPSHPDIASSLNNLAVLLDNTNRYGEAEPLYREALDIRRAAFPPDHSDVVISVENLAVLLQNTGRYAEAEPLHREVLVIRRATLPPSHPAITVSLKNLANLLDRTGRSEEAKALDIEHAGQL